MIFKLGCSRLGLPTLRYILIPHCTYKIFKPKKTVSSIVRDRLQKKQERHAIVDIYEKMPAQKLAAQLKGGLRLPLLGTLSLKASIAFLNSNSIPYQIIVSECHEDNFDPEEIADPPSENLTTKRPPVVAILGHVDHGKTTLLDAIRGEGSRLADSEAGGITQRIGAFEAAGITWLDTPGHAAFDLMRARGAAGADMVILVIAADSRVQPQTEECLEILERTQTPFIIALTKIDRVSSIQEVEIELRNIPNALDIVPVCAIKNQGINDLCESIHAAIGELYCDISERFHGIVIESHNKKSLGPVATILGQRGTIEKGDVIISGRTWAKVRSIGQFSTLLPGHAAEFSGFKSIPKPGDLVLAVSSQQRARQIVNKRKRILDLEKSYQDEKILSDQREATNAARIEKLLNTNVTFKAYNKFRHFEERKAQSTRENQKGDVFSIPLIVKCDSEGSLETVLKCLIKAAPQLVCISYDVSPISLSDIETAAAAGALIIGFNVTSTLDELAEEKNVTILTSDVIYHLLDAIKEKAKSLLTPNIMETILGEAEVLQLFNVTVNKKIVPVVGCRVNSGELVKSKKFRVSKSNNSQLESEILEMRILKKESSVVSNGQTCGLRFDLPDIEVGDTITCYDTYLEPQDINFD